MPQDEFALKPVTWIGGSLEKLREFPPVAQDKIGRALQKVQYGSKPITAKVLSGFHGASILEIRTDYDGDTYRTIYTTRYEECIYVLHAFQKKSTRGIQTAKQDIEMIQTRLKMAESAHQRFIASQGE